MGLEFFKPKTSTKKKLGFANPKYKIKNVLYKISSYGEHMVEKLWKRLERQSS